MNILLVVLWFVFCFLIGYFIGKAFRKRILKRRVIEKEFYYYPPIATIKKGDVEGDPFETLFN